MLNIPKGLAVQPRPGGRYFCSRLADHGACQRSLGQTSGPAARAQPGQPVSGFRGCQQRRELRIRQTGQQGIDDGDRTTLPHVHGLGPQHAALKRGVEFLSKKKPSPNNMYYNYYATQVLHHYGGDEWTKWNEVMREQLVKTQILKGHGTGSWDPPTHTARRRRTALHDLPGNHDTGSSLPPPATV